MSDYPNKGIPLMPSVAAPLILEFLSLRQAKRNEIINFVVTQHKMRGGKDGTSDTTSCIKKALSNLQKQEMIRSLAYGLYEATNRSEEHVLSTTKNFTEPTQANKLIPLRSLGEGTGCVYLYYFDLYKSEASRKGEPSWPCKIGLSENEASSRISQQIGTALPEIPVLALEVKTNNPSWLESAIHSVLKCRGKWHQKSPGSEWFMTSPEEVLEIYSFIAGQQ